MSEEEAVNSKEQTIRAAIEQKMGKVFIEETSEIVQRQFEEIPLVNRCGDVSRITQKVIGGEIRVFSARGENPSIFLCS